MDEMIGEFITETTESLGLLDQELVRLEQHPQDIGILSNIFRVMHTIKGTCGFLGLSRLEKVAHAAENILGKFRDGVMQVTPEAITLILQSADCIKEIVEHIGKNGHEPEGDDSVLIHSLNQFVENGGAPLNAPAASEPANASHHFKGDDDLEALIQQAEATQKKVEAAPAPVEAPPAIEPVAAKTTTQTKAEPKESSAGSTTQSIRVNLDVLERMMQMVSELVLSRNQLMQIARASQNQEFLSPLQQLSHITTELQESVMKTRMQPIGSAWGKFPRLVRDLSLELGKKIDLRMIGEDTELDRQLLEAVKDPLTHMVRNSCDHGLETPEQRKATGKPETGTVTLNAYHDGGHIVIDITDDGKGINTDRIKEKIIANGMATPAEVAGMSERQILQFIFRPGFSTAEKVTAVSGRGVGMDVVRTNIEKIGGTIDLSSTMGQGSKVSIKIPLTLAIVSVLIVESGNEKFALPQINVRELIQVGKKSQIKLEFIENATVIRLRDTLLPIVALSDILHVGNPVAITERESAFVVVCNVGGTDFGIIVDRVHNIEEIVVKPVSEAVKSVPLFSGNTILGDGTVIMILEPNNLAKAIGNTNLSNQTTTKSEENALTGTEAHPVTGFVVFNFGNNVPKAVPLELVWRLEEIDASLIERAGAVPIVQYRGELMRLLQLESVFTLPEVGKVQVIVFSYDNKVVGLPVHAISDIVHVPFDLKLASKDKGYLGSMVIGGKTTDVVDVSSLLETYGDMDTSSANNNNGKVLLVDDSPFLRKMTVPFLIAAGYQVKSVESGIEALAALEQAVYDIIVTDLQMPGMDGFRLAESCRNFAQCNNTPIIGFTSSMDSESLNKCKKAGMVTCVLKNNRPGLLEAMSTCKLASRKAA